MDMTNERALDILATGDEAWAFYCAQQDVGFDHAITHKDWLSRAYRALANRHLNAPIIASLDNRAACDRMIATA